MVQNDKISKQKMKDYADTKRHTKPSDLIPGDHVLVKQPKTNKMKPPVQPQTLHHRAEEGQHDHSQTSVTPHCPQLIALQALPKACVYS